MIDESKGLIMKMLIVVFCAALMFLILLAGSGMLSQLLGLSARDKIKFDADEIATSVDLQSAIQEKAKIAVETPLYRCQFNFSDSYIKSTVGTKKWVHVAFHTSTLSGGPIRCGAGRTIVIKESGVVGK